MRLAQQTAIASMLGAFALGMGHLLSLTRIEVLGFKITNWQRNFYATLG
jgi:hypothetical protein